MKILVLSNYFPEHIGGIEFVANNLVQNYRANGHAVRWIACTVQRSLNNKHPDNHHLRCNNFTEDRLGFPYPLPRLNSLPIIYRDVFWCDVIHIHDCLYVANILAFIISRIKKKPVLLTQHVAAISYRQNYKKILQTIAYRSIGKMLVQGAERVVFITPTVHEWFAKFASTRKPATDLPNGCDNELFYPIESGERREYRQKLDLPSDKQVFIFVGRFTEKKGVHIIRSLVSKYPNIFWVLIGREGDEDPWLWTGHNFRIIDNLPQNDLREYYWAADLLILPSSGEGFPLVVQEAMSCGTVPLVSGDIFDSLQDSNAPLFKALLTPSAFSQQIDQILENFNHIDDLQLNAARYAKGKWSWEYTTGEYLRLLNQVQSEYTRRARPPRIT